MKRLSLKTLVILLWAALLMVSCAPAATASPVAATGSEATEPPAASPTDTAAPAEEASPTASSAAEPLEIEFWTLLTGNLAQTLDDMVQQYNATHPEVKIVNVNQGGYAEIQQKMLAAVAAGNPPVISMMDYKNVPYYAQAGVLEPLNDYETAEDVEDFIPGLLADLTVDGKLYGLPFNRSTQGVYYNKELFQTAGLDPEKPPETWDELLEYSQAIQKLGDDYYGIYATGNMQWFFEAYVYQAGGEFSDADCNFTFNDEYGQQAAQYLQDLVYKYNVALIPSVLTGTFDQKQIEFVNGKVGMTRDSTALNSYIGSSVDFDWGFAMLPAGPAGRFVTSGGANLVVSAKASPEEKQAAWDFIRWLTNTENSAAFSMANGYLPTRYSVTELPEMQEFYEAHPTWKTSVDELQYVHPTSCGVLNVPSWETTMNGAMDRILVNHEDVKTVLDETVAELNATIADARNDGTLIKK